MRENALKAKVKAVNRCHEEAMKLYDRLVEVFRPLVGHKITKVDGSLLAKVAKLLPKFPLCSGHSVYRGGSDHTLGWCVKTCEAIEDGNCLYYEIGVYLGNMSNGVLNNIMDRPMLRTDYTASQIRAKRKTFKEARKAMEVAEAVLWPFHKEFDS